MGFDRNPGHFQKVNFWNYVWNRLETIGYVYFVHLRLQHQFTVNYFIIEKVHFSDQPGLRPGLRPGLAHMHSHQFFLAHRKVWDL